MERIREHGVRLSGETSTGIGVELRPLTEQDWDLLLSLRAFGRQGIISS